MKALAFKKGVSLGLSIVYFTTQIALGNQAESSVWAERRRNTPQNHSQDLAYAGASPLLGSAFPSVAPIKPIGSFNPLKFSPALRPLLEALPLSNVIVQDTNSPEDPKEPPVVIVQDVHMNNEAQTNIAAALQSLIDAKAVQAVGVEGAFTNFDFAPFRKYDDKKMVRWITESFMNKNMLAAPSFVGITSAIEPPAFIGIDDRAHYDANVQAYLDSRSEKPRIEKFLEEQKRRIGHEKQQTFSRALREFDELRTHHHDGSISLGKYVQELAKTEEFAPLSALERFHEAYRIEQSLDFARVEHERKTALEDLAHRLSEQEVQQLLAQSMHYKLGRLSIGRYFSYLKDVCDQKGVGLHKFPAFQTYLQYVLLADGIKANQLFDEIEKVETNITNKLATTDEERRLLAVSDRLNLTAKLIDFSLTPKEWGAYRQSMDNRLSTIDLSAFETFYVEADTRSNKFVESLERKPMAIVVGGFHTPHITELLKKKKVPYVVVSPKITKIEEGSGSAYLTVFAREKTPIERLFEGEKLFLAPKLNIVDPETNLLEQGSLQARLNHQTEIEVKIDGKTVLADAKIVDQSDPTKDEVIIRRSMKDRIRAVIGRGAQSDSVPQSFKDALAERFSALPADAKPILDEKDILRLAALFNEASLDGPLEIMFDTGFGDPPTDVHKGKIKRWTSIVIVPETDPLVMKLILYEPIEAARKAEGKTKNEIWLGDGKIDPTKLRVPETTKKMERYRLFFSQLKSLLTEKDYDAFVVAALDLSKGPEEQLENLKKLGFEHQGKDFAYTDLNSRKSNTASIFGDNPIAVMLAPYWEWIFRVPMIALYVHGFDPYLVAAVGGVMAVIFGFLHVNRTFNQRIILSFAGLLFSLASLVPFLAGDTSSATLFNAWLWETHTHALWNLIAPLFGGPTASLENFLNEARTIENQDLIDRSVLYFQTRYGITLKISFGDDENVEKFFYRDKTYDFIFKLIAIDHWLQALPQEAAREKLSSKTLLLVKKMKANYDDAAYLKNNILVLELEAPDPQLKLVEKLGFSVHDPAEILSPIKSGTPLPHPEREENIAALSAILGIGLDETQAAYDTMVFDMASRIKHTTFLPDGIDKAVFLFLDLAYNVTVVGTRNDDQLKDITQVKVTFTNDRLTVEKKGKEPATYDLVANGRSLKVRLPAGDSDIEEFFKNEIYPNMQNTVREVLDLLETGGVFLPSKRRGGVDGFRLGRTATVEFRDNGRWYSTGLSNDDERARKVLTFGFHFHPGSYGVLSDGDKGVLKIEARSNRRSATEIIFTDATEIPIHDIPYTYDYKLQLLPMTLEQFGVRMLAYVYTFDDDTDLDWEQQGVRTAGILFDRLQTLLKMDEETFERRKKLDKAAMDMSRPLKDLTEPLANSNRWKNIFKDLNTHLFRTSAGKFEVVRFWETLGLGDEYRKMFKTGKDFWSSDLSFREIYQQMKGKGTTGSILDPLLDRNSAAYVPYTVLGASLWETAVFQWGLFCLANQIMPVECAMLLVALLFSAAHTIVAWRANALENGRKEIASFVIRFLLSLLFTVPFLNLPFLPEFINTMPFVTTVAVHALYNATVLLLRWYFLGHLDRVDWREMVRDVQFNRDTKSPQLMPETPRQLAYERNIREARVEFYRYFRNFMNGEEDAVEDLQRLLETSHRLVANGSHGDSAYSPDQPLGTFRDYPIGIKDLTDADIENMIRHAQGLIEDPYLTQFINSEIQQIELRLRAIRNPTKDEFAEFGSPYPINIGQGHAYPNQHYFPDYLKAMLEILKDYRQMHQADRSPSDAKIKKIAEFYQYGINAHFFGVTNNSLLMNMVNAMLRDMGLRGIEHGLLDFEAMALQEDNFQPLFLSDVKRANRHFTGWMMWLARWLPLASITEKQLREVTEQEWLKMFGEDKWNKLKAQEDFNFQELIDATASDLETSLALMGFLRKIDKDTLFYAIADSPEEFIALLNEAKNSPDLINHLKGITKKSESFLQPNFLINKLKNINFLNFLNLNFETEEERTRKAIAKTNIAAEVTRITKLQVFQDRFIQILLAGEKSASANQIKLDPKNPFKLILEMPKLQFGPSAIMVMKRSSQRLKEVPPEKLNELLSLLKDYFPSAYLTLYEKQEDSPLGMIDALPEGELDLSRIKSVLQELTEKLGPSASKLSLEDLLGLIFFPDISVEFEGKTVTRETIFNSILTERRFRIPSYLGNYLSALRTVIKQKSGQFTDEQYPTDPKLGAQWSYENTADDDVRTLLSKPGLSGHLAIHQTKNGDLLQAIVQAGYLISREVFESLNERNIFEQLLDAGKVNPLGKSELVHFAIDHPIGGIDSPYAIVYPVEVLLENQGFTEDPLHTSDWPVGGFSPRLDHPSHRIPINSGVILMPKSARSFWENTFRELETKFPGWKRPSKIFYHSGKTPEDAIREFRQAHAALSPSLLEPTEKITLSRRPIPMRKLTSQRWKGSYLFSVKDVKDSNGITHYKQETRLTRLAEVQDFSGRLEDLAFAVAESMSGFESIDEVADSGSAKRGTYQERTDHFPDDFDLMMKFNGGMPSQVAMERFANGFAATLQEKPWLATIYGGEKNSYRVEPERGKTSDSVFIRPMVQGGFLIKFNIYKGKEQNIPILSVDVVIFNNEELADGLRYQRKVAGVRKNGDLIEPGYIDILLQNLKTEKEKAEGRQIILSVIRGLKAVFKNNGIYKREESGLRGVGTEQLVFQLNGVTDQFGTPRPVESLAELKEIFTVVNALAFLEEAMFDESGHFAGVEGFKDQLPLWDPGALVPTALTEHMTEDGLARLVDITYQATNDNPRAPPKSKSKFSREKTNRHTIDGNFDFSKLLLLNPGLMPLLIKPQSNGINPAWEVVFQVFLGIGLVAGFGFWQLVLIAALSSILFGMFHQNEGRDKQAVLAILHFLIFSGAMALPFAFASDPNLWQSIGLAVIGMVASIFTHLGYNRLKRGLERSNYSWARSLGNWLPLATVRAKTLLPDLQKEIADILRKGWRRDLSPKEYSVIGLVLNDMSASSPALRKEPEQFLIEATHEVVKTLPHLSDPQHFLESVEENRLTARDNFMIVRLGWHLAKTMGPNAELESGQPSRVLAEIRNLLADIETAKNVMRLVKEGGFKMTPFKGITQDLDELASSRRDYPVVSGQDQARIIFLDVARQLGRRWPGTTPPKQLLERLGKLLETKRMTSQGAWKTLYVSLQVSEFMDINANGEKKLNESDAQNLKTALETLSGRKDVRVLAARTIQRRFAIGMDGAYDLLLGDMFLPEKMHADVEKMALIHEIFHVNSIGLDVTFLNEGLTQLLTLRMLMKIEGKKTRALDFYEELLGRAGRDEGLPAYFVEVAVAVEALEFFREGLIKLYFNGDIAGLNGKLETWKQFREAAIEYEKAAIPDRPKKLQEMREILRGNFAMENGTTVEDSPAPSLKPERKKAPTRKDATEIGSAMHYFQSQEFDLSDPLWDEKVAVLEKFRDQLEYRVFAKLANWLGTNKNAPTKIKARVLELVMEHIEQNPNGKNAGNIVTLINLIALGKIKDEPLRSRVLAMMEAYSKKYSNIKGNSLPKMIEGIAECLAQYPDRVYSDILKKYDLNQQEQVAIVNGLAATPASAPSELLLIEALSNSEIKEQVRNKLFPLLWSNNLSPQAQINLLLLAKKQKNMTSSLLRDVAAAMDSTSSSSKAIEIIVAMLAEHKELINHGKFLNKDNSDIFWILVDQLRSTRITPEHKSLITDILLLESKEAAEFHPGELRFYGELGNHMRYVLLDPNVPPAIRKRIYAAVPGILNPPVKPKDRHPADQELVNRLNEMKTTMGGLSMIVKLLFFPIAQKFPESYDRYVAPTIENLFVLGAIAIMHFNYDMSIFIASAWAWGAFAAVHLLELVVGWLFGRAPPPQNFVFSLLIAATGLIPYAGPVVATILHYFINNYFGQKEAKPADTKNRRAELDVLKARIEEKKKEFVALAEETLRNGDESMVMDQERALKRMDRVHERGVVLLNVGLPELFDLYMAELAMPLMSYEAGHLNLLLSSRLLRDLVQEYTFYIDRPTVMYLIERKSRWEAMKNNFYLRNLPIVAELSSADPALKERLHAAGQLLREYYNLSKDRMMPIGLGQVESLIMVPEVSRRGDGHTSMDGHPTIAYLDRDEFQLATTIRHEGQHHQFGNWMDHRERTISKVKLPWDADSMIMLAHEFAIYVEDMEFQLWAMREKIRPELLEDNISQIMIAVSALQVLLRKPLSIELTGDDLRLVYRSLEKWIAAGKATQKLTDHTGLAKAVGDLEKISNEEQIGHSTKHGAWYQSLINILMLSNKMSDVQSKVEKLLRGYPYAETKQFRQMFSAIKYGIENNQMLWREFETEGPPAMIRRMGLSWKVQDMDRYMEIMKPLAAAMNKYPRDEVGFNLFIQYIVHNFPEGFEAMPTADDAKKMVDLADDLLGELNRVRPDNKKTAAMAANVVPGLSIILVTGEFMDFLKKRGIANADGIASASLGSNNHISSYVIFEVHSPELGYIKQGSVLTWPLIHHEIHHFIWIFLEWADAVKKPANDFRHFRHEIIAYLISHPNDMGRLIVPNLVYSKDAALLAKAEETRDILGRATAKGYKNGVPYEALMYAAMNSADFPEIIENFEAIAKESDAQAQKIAAIVAELQGTPASLGVGEKTVTRSDELTMLARVMEKLEPANVRRDFGPMMAAELKERPVMVLQGKVEDRLMVGAMAKIGLKTPALWLVEEGTQAHFESIREALKRAGSNDIEIKTYKPGESPYDMSKGSFILWAGTVYTFENLFPIEKRLQLEGIDRVIRQVLAAA